VAFFSAFSPFAFKQLSLAEDEPFRALSIKSSLVRKSYLFLLGYLVILILGFVLGWLFVELFFREKYGASLQYFPYFMCANFFGTVYSVFSVYIFFLKKTKYLGLITISIAIFQVFITIILVKKYGAIGAGIANAVASIVTAAIVAYLSNRLYPMPWLLKTSIKR
jgi:O-antigen/teichoic acid export membrane protein